MAESLVVALYVGGIVPWLAISYYWFPWSPYTIKVRFAGALVQAPLWPLALFVWWRLMHWEHRCDFAIGEASDE